MRVFGGLFDWATGKRKSCECCHKYLTEDDGEHVLTVEFPYGKRNFSLCNKCSVSFDTGAVGG